jgi:hypothetical protein
MPCYPMSDDYGKISGCVCGEKLNLDHELCEICGDFLYNTLCDFPAGDNATCDKKMCEKCEVSIHPYNDIHFCDEHAAMYIKYHSGELDVKIKERYQDNTRHLRIAK